MPRGQNLTTEIRRRGGLNAWQGRRRPALERFAEKCRFEPRTGCVLWTGGTSSGQAKTALYGVFWFEGKRWFVHRWAAQYIHALDIEGLEVDHECKNTLCVQHLEAVTGDQNLALRWGRRFWGWDEWQPEPIREGLAVPAFDLPEWLAPYHEPVTTEVPF